MSNFERGVRDELRAPDGDAPRHADPVQDKAHGGAAGLKSRDIALSPRQWDRCIQRCAGGRAAYLRLHMSQCSRRDIQRPNAADTRSLIPGSLHWFPAFSYGSVTKSAGLCVTQSIAEMRRRFRNLLSSPRKRGPSGVRTKDTGFPLRGSTDSLTGDAIGGAQ